MKQITNTFLILICVLFATIAVSAQTNLLLNGKADSKTEHWHARGEGASVEEFNGDKVFVLRNGGLLQQYVQLTDDAIGKYALFIGRVSSEQVNIDGKPNLPLLYIWMLATSAKNDGQIIRDNAKGENEWQTIYAIHQVTKEDFPTQSMTHMKCFLVQREKYVPNDGSEVRFDNLGLYLFATEKEAQDFARAYK